MRYGMKRRVGVGSTVTIGAVGFAMVYFLSCTSAPLPFVVTGPGGVGNDPPTLTITEPTADLTIGQGDLFLIAWEDSDRDDNARIRFELLSTESADRILLITGIAENPDVPAQSTHTVSTNLLPLARYNLLGVIDDGVNAPVEAFAMTTGATVAQRLVINIVDQGTGPQTVPPVVTVSQPAFNQSVAQNDTLNILIQPAAFFDLNPMNTANNPPFDQDSNATLFILLDDDLDPNNDDPRNPDESGIILLDTRTVTAMANGQIMVPVTIDLARIPPRADGQPYNIRATIDDATNPAVHSYAPGTISVVRLAAGVVDLFDAGRTTSGATFKGFNPGANLGSSISSVSDFDIDGTDDFIMVAQFGNPQNAGPVGEAYLVYGQDQTRFGSVIPINTVSNSVSGVIFQAPPVRTQAIPGGGARTDGITDVSFANDLSGDGRPELLFGLGHVHGAYDGTDYDPGDDAASPTLNPFLCFPDQLVNNITDPGEDFEFYAGGMAIVVNSSNRDNSGLILNPGGGRANQPRLDSTAVTLELAGQTPRILDASGESLTGNFSVRADNFAVVPLGTDDEEPGRIAGARFIAGGYDFLLQFEPPREGLFGQTFRSLGDLNADTVDELIISAPLNERHLADLQTSFGFSSTHVASTRFTGSIVVPPGTNYNATNWRDRDDENGSSTIPFLDHWQFPPFGSCSSTPTTARGYVVPADTFEIFAEDIDDFLGDGQSAGDFNQDGLDDILCGAPLNDRSGSLLDTGVTYVIYGRSVFGEIRLANADNALTRPPMLRVRGLRRGDQIGSQQAAGLDVNGDRIDDFFISSPHTDFGGVTRATCGEDFNGDGVKDSGDFELASFNTCLGQFGTEVFTSDTCKAFDYDNDGDIDEDDRCVFCCLSGDCDPDDACVFGQGQNCCGDLVDNGFVGIVFGGEFIDGDRTIGQLATDQLPGTVFFGAGAGHRAGADISSAGDFNQDGFGDILITAPGEIRLDSAGRERLGVVYLVFGGTHLTNATLNLKDVGSLELPGIVFISPYVKGRPNEAPPQTVAFIGDINNDGFGDIAIGNPAADFIDSTFPQGPDAPGSDPSTGRRSNVGDVYVIYGNNFGPNRETP